MANDKLGHSVQAAEKITEPSAKRVAHVIPCFLPPSATFIYTQLRSQAALNQIVVARRTVNHEWFPFDHVYESAPFELSKRRERAMRATRHLVGQPNNYQRQIIQLARESGSEVIHAHFGWSGIEAVLPARHLDVPLVTAFHGSDVYVRNPRDRIHNSYRKLFRTGAAFTCVGPRAGDELVRRGCPRERLWIVPVGIDLSEFPYRKAVPSEPFTILQVSRLTAKKGVDLSLRAFAKARRSIDGARLWIVGEGPEKESLTTLAQRLGINDYVTFYGAAASSQIQDLMRKAHLGLQPSRIAPNGDREGTPTVLLEFQAIGVDIVATHHADIPSIVAHPEELVEENNVDQLVIAMRRSAARSATAQRERADAGRALIERRHDATQIATQLAEIYRDTIELGCHA
jgi:colanic acid/amylovoran biosynthesis glycosyltransferase